MRSARSALIQEFTRGGQLRASINLGNPILASRPAGVGEPQGVSVDLARGFARHLGVPLRMVVFDAAGKAAQALAAGAIDIGFLAIDPQRATEIRFTPPYVHIEGGYLVAAASPIVGHDQVDRPGVRVMVGAGSAYDLHLTRTLRHAAIVRAPTSPAVVDAFLEQQAEVAAGVRQQLEADARRLGGLRLLDDGFMTIRQAVGIPRHYSDAALHCLSTFVEDMKRSGFVADSLARHRIDGAGVAPPALETI